MKKFLVLAALVFAIPFYVSAYSFTFSGTDKGGTGSADMDVTLNSSGSQLVAEIWNTSPVKTDDGQDDNYPMIDGFGFFLDNLEGNETGNTAAPTFSTWSLTAYTTASPSSEVEIGSDDLLTGDWNLFYEPTSSQGATGVLYLDYLTTNGSGNDAGLYNPLLDPTILGSGTHYFTKATLTIDLDSVLTFQDGSGAYVRMQRVGTNADGSLKLFDYWEDGGIPPTEVIPEPSTFLLLGAGLASLAFYRRKKS